MNRITKDLLTLLLADPKSRKKDGVSLDVKMINNELILAREFLLQRDVYFPAYHRACSLLRLFIPEDQHEDYFVYGSLDDQNAGWILSCEDFQLQEELDIMLQHYLDWYYLRHPEWLYEEASEAEMLSLNVPVKLVADRPLQPSMF